MFRLSITVFLFFAPVLQGCGEVGGHFAGGFAGGFTSEIVASDAVHAASIGVYGETPDQTRAHGLQGSLLIDRSALSAAHCATKELGKLTRPFKYLIQLQSVQKSQASYKIPVFVVGAVSTGGPGFIIDFLDVEQNQTEARFYLAESIMDHKTEVITNLRGALYRCMRNNS